MMFSGINSFILPLSIIDTQHGLSPLLIVENFGRLLMTGCRTVAPWFRSSEWIIDPCHSILNDNMSRKHLKLRTINWLRHSKLCQQKASLVRCCKPTTPPFLPHFSTRHRRFSGHWGDHQIIPGWVADSCWQLLGRSPLDREISRTSWRQKWSTCHWDWLKSHWLKSLLAAYRDIPNSAWRLKKWDRNWPND